MNTPDAPAPAEQALAACHTGMETGQAVRTFGTTLAALQEACGDSDEGHDFLRQDNGEEWRWYRSWEACGWCDKIREEQR